MNYCKNYNHCTDTGTNMGGGLDLTLLCMTLSVIEWAIMIRHKHYPLREVSTSSRLSWSNIRLTENVMMNCDLYESSRESAHILFLGLYIVEPWVQSNFIFGLVFYIFSTSFSDKLIPISEKVISISEKINAYSEKIHLI